MTEIPIRRRSQALPGAARLLFGLLGRLQEGSLSVLAPDGEGHRFTGRSPGLHATLRLKDWAVCEAILRRGDIGFAEAYLDGRWDTPNLCVLLELAAANRAALEPAVYGTWWGGLLYRIRHLLNANTRRGSRKNIHAHYDLGNAFYEGWLDRTMTYSAALFEGRTDLALEDAQIAKYERILKVLDVGRESRILEIGCGWGGFALHAAATRGCRVTGITLSKEQLSFASQRAHALGLSDRAEFHLCDYRDIAGTFDRVVSIEMFEAVGERYWPDFFSTLRDRLGRGGRALIQTITIDDRLFDAYRRGTDFIQQYVFPGGMLPSTTAFKEHSSRASLTVSSTYAFGLDYAETLRRWRERYLAAASSLRTLGFDDRFERLWQFYLSYCEAGFRSGNTDVLQVELRRE